jgi:hypothetical protein
MTMAAASAAMLMLAAGAAQAGERSYWVKCDGLPAPEKVGVTTARVGAAILTGGLYALTVEGPGSPEPGQAGIDACSTALGQPGLPDFWSRHISLLRARALHKAEVGDLDGALADLQATKAVGSGHIGEAAFTRSLGVSIKLFQAALLAKRGETAESERLALEAAAERPYSLRVQSLAASLLQVDPAYGPDEDRVQTQRAMLDPDALAQRAAAREWGDPAKAADDWLMRLADVRRLPADGVLLTESFEYQDGSAVLLPYPLAKAALASARAGRTEEARALLAELEGLKPWTPPQPPKRKREAQRLAGVTASSERAIARVEPYKRLVKAWLAAEDKRFDEATDLLNAGPVPVEAATYALVSQVNAGRRGGASSDADKLTEATRARTRDDRREHLKVIEFARALPLLEAPRGSPFKAQGMFSSGFGFSDRAIKTGGWRIAFGGYSGLPTAEEMNLLRAAQLAKAKGATGFAVFERRDFQRYMVQSGMPAIAPDNPNPQNVETVLEVFFTGPGATAPPAQAAGRAAFALDADKVWAELSPVYVEREAVASR